MPEQDCKLFLAGLNFNTNEDGIRLYFKKYGNIADCVVMRFQDTRRSRGFGFVTFSKSSEADYCLRDTPHIIDSSMIETKRATPKEEIDKDSKVSGEIFRKLFVGGLNFSTTESGLRIYFEQFGEVVDAVIMKFRDTNRSRGFGFVTFASKEVVDEVQRNRPHRIDETKVETKRATPREETARGDSGQNIKRIFVGGLRDAIEDEDLEKYFSSFGRVISVEQMVEKGTNKRRGFGFVEFDDYDPVDKIILQPLHTIDNWKIDVKKAVGRNEIQGRSWKVPSPWAGDQRPGLEARNFGNQGSGNQEFGGQGFSRQVFENNGPWNNSGNPSPWQSCSGMNAGSWDDQGNDWSSSGFAVSLGNSTNKGESFNRDGFGGPMRNSGIMASNNSRIVPYSVGGTSRASARGFGGVTRGGDGYVDRMRDGLFGFGEGSRGGSGGFVESAIREGASGYGGRSNGGYSRGGDGGRRW